MAKKGQTFRHYSEEWKHNAVQMCIKGEMGYEAFMDEVSHLN